ncbi:fimbrial protein [Ewingella americana]|uniref:Type 1 fimbrial protein n=1 Tax=Ewingella americana TaxID=41202 RepID=A0A502GAV1_9GAMM|nr:fimbrial protein [Ewingella americana]TPG58792.1 type 1 fimbrial protein [Ewingella americana]
MKNKLSFITGGLFMALSANSLAIDGIINFHGSIITQACEINGGQDVDVQLGTYSAAQFRSIGDKSPSIPFTLPLTNCPVATAEDPTVPQFRIWLEAPTVTDHPDLVQVTSAFDDDTIADGVGVKILDGQTKAVMQLNTLPEIIYKISKASMNVDLIAYYESYKAPTDIKAGPAEASVNVTLDYR